MNLLTALNSALGTKHSSLSDKGQELLVRDWRFQEMESAIYHNDLTATLNSVWNTWVSDLNYLRPEFSALRKMPKYHHEFEDTNLNIDKALARGASIIMACPVLSNTCNYGPLCIRSKWQAGRLVFTIKKSVSLFEQDKEQAFYNLENLIMAIQKTIDSGEDFSLGYLLQNQGIAVL